MENNNVIIKVDTDELKCVVGTAMRAVSTSSVRQAILKCLKIEVRGTNLVVTGCDLEMTIITSPINVDSSNDAVFALEGKMFYDMLRVLDGVNTELRLKDRTLNIKSGKAKYNMPCADEADYPVIEEYTGTNKYILPAQAFKRMTKQVIYAIDGNSNSDKAMMRGPLIEIEADEISMVGLDGYRISHAKCKFEQDIFGTYSVIIPAKSIQELVRLIPDDESIEFGYTDNYARFKTNSFTLLTRIINGQYLNYRAMFEFEANTTLEIHKADLIQALEKVAVISNSLKTPVNIEIKNDIMDLSVADGGFSASDTLDITKDGKDNIISVNHLLLLEAAKSINDEVLTISLTTELAPLVIKGEKNKESRHLVLPVRRKA